MIFNQRIGGAGGASAVIFAYGGLVSTDTVYAEKDGERINGVYATKPDPDYAGLPAAYQQVEYLESTGEQWIDTNIYNGCAIELSFIDFVHPGGQRAMFGNENKSSPWASTYVRYENDGTATFGVLSSGVFTIDRSFIGSHDLYAECFDSYKKLYYDGELLFEQSISAQYNSYSLFLFGQNSGGTISKPSNVKIKKCKIYAEKNRENQVRNFIPCYRVSDNKPGMYDLCGSICPLTGTPFYINSGTGADFLAEGAVPQYKTGFEITPIREYGTWVLTATHGGSTKTINVLVDAAEEFEAEVTA